MGDMDMILRLRERASDADKRMQYLQDAIDQRTHWLDAAKERIEALEKTVADLAGRLDKSAAAHADEFERLEKRIQAAEVRILGVEGRP